MSERDRKKYTAIPIQRLTVIITCKKKKLKNPHKIIRKKTTKKQKKKPASESTSDSLMIMHMQWKIRYYSCDHKMNGHVNCLNIKEDFEDLTFYYIFFYLSMSINPSIALQIFF